MKDIAKVCKVARRVSLPARAQENVARGKVTMQPPLEVDSLECKCHLRPQGKEVIFAEKAGFESAGLLVVLAVAPASQVAHFVEICDQELITSLVDKRPLHLGDVRVREYLSVCVGILYLVPLLTIAFFAKIPDFHHISHAVSGRRDLY